MQVAPNCAFRAADVVTLDSEGGIHLHRDALEGVAPLDIGGGRIAQKLVDHSSPCIEVESLVLVDCRSGEAIAIQGSSVPVFSMAQYRETGLATSDFKVRYLQPPHGPISLTSDTTIALVASVATRYGLNRSEVLSTLSLIPQRDRFDSTCGCKLFYPDLGTGTN